MANWWIQMVGSAANDQKASHWSNRGSTPEFCPHWSVSWSDSRWKTREKSWRFTLLVTFTIFVNSVNPLVHLHLDCSFSYPQRYACWIRFIRLIIRKNNFLISIITLHSKWTILGPNFFASRLSFDWKTELKFDCIRIVSRFNKPIRAP